MKPFIRTSLVLVLLVAGSSGCSGVRTTIVKAPSATPLPRAAPAVPAAPSLPAPAGIDDYKTQVARHLILHNPAHVHQGVLPPLLPAVVVLTITVERDGRLADVQVRRSRNDGAAALALDAVRRSTPLPPPQQLAETGQLTFLETFLFADSQRYQLRSMAPLQASE